MLVDQDLKQRARRPRRRSDRLHGRRRRPPRGARRPSRHAADGAAPRTDAPSSPPRRHGGRQRAAVPAGRAARQRRAAERVESCATRSPPQAFARVMPSARRALERARAERRTTCEPTGPGGRVLKEDVLRAREKRRGAGRQPARAGADRGERDEEVVPMSPIRRRIAERLVEAQQTAALLTTFNEIDMSAVMALRKQHQDAFRRSTASSSASCRSSSRRRSTRSSWSRRSTPRSAATTSSISNYYDIGIAVGGGKGLVVPVLRNAERLSFAEIELAIADFGARAQGQQARRSTSCRAARSRSPTAASSARCSRRRSSTRRKAASSGLHAIQDRPVAVDGQVVIRPMMYVALTYDHRIVDGREAVTFLKRIKDCVEEPSADACSKSEATGATDGDTARFDRHRRRPRRLRRRHSRGAARPERRVRRERAGARRHLPARRLHPEQGAARVQRALPRGVARARATSA